MTTIASDVLGAAQLLAAERMAPFHAAHFQDVELRHGVMISVTGHPDPSLGTDHQTGERSNLHGPAFNRASSAAYVNDDAESNCIGDTQDDESVAPFKLVMNPEWAERFAKRMGILDERDKRLAKKARRAKSVAAKKCARSSRGDNAK